LLYKKTNIKIILILIIALITFFSFLETVPADNIQEIWVKLKDISNTDRAYDVTTDSNNNVIVTGVANGYAYTIKYNKNGNFIWDQTGFMGFSRGITTDNDDNIIITGGSSNCHTIKYNPAGYELWNKDYDSGYTDYAYDVKSDSQNNIIIVGQTNSDYSIIKYNPSGNIIWNTTFNSGGADEAYGVTVDTEDNIIVTGGASGDYNTVKYDSNGNYLWNVSYDGGDLDKAWDVTTDSNNNIIVTGESYITSYDTIIYTIKYDSNGNEIKNVSPNTNWQCYASSLSVDNYDNIIVSGTIYVEPGPNTNYYTIKYDENLNQIWTKTYDNSLNTDICRGNTVDSLNKIIVTGQIKRGQSDWDYCTIKYNEPPTADFTYEPLTITTEDQIWFNDTSTDPVGEIVNWSWNLGDGHVSYNQNTVHSYDDDGQYTVTLTVNDDDLLTDIKTRQITVLNVPPKTDFTYIPSDPNDLDIIYFIDNSTDSDGTITSYHWDFDDGTTSTLQNPTHSYAHYGNYSTELTITDNDGATDTANRIITVIDITKPTIIDDTSTDIGYNGKPFTFKAIVTDNGDIENVEVTYWYGTNLPSTNPMIKTDGNNYETTITIADTLEILYYNLTAYDTFNNYNHTDNQDITIYDDTPPIITNVEAKPDSQECFGFVDITCDVNDNIMIDLVTVNITGPEGFIPVDTIMNHSTNYFYNQSYEIFGTYTYKISALDTSGNFNISESNTFVIRDITFPEIIDQSPISCTTGEGYTFNATITDNICVDWVEVIYWHDGDIPISEDMVNSAGDFYEHSIIIPHTLNTLYYYLTATDTSGNEKNTIIKNVIVNDNDPPELFNDQTEDNCTTSEFVTFIVNATDNINVEHVYVYWRKTGETSYIKQEMTENDITYYWTYNIDPNDNSNIEYYFQALDAVPLSDIMYSPDNPSIILIADNDAPVISDINADPSPQECSSSVNITCDVNDNIQLDSVKIIITGPEGFTDINTTMNQQSGKHYYYERSYNILGDYEYKIWANDSSDNSNMSTTHTFEIIDTTPPTITDNTPQTATTGDSFMFTAEVKDNLQVDWVEIRYWYGSNNPDIETMTNVIDDIYEYPLMIIDTLEILNYQIIVKDTNDNWNNTQTKHITINDNDKPQITDNTPSIATTGETFTFSATVIDNIQVSTVGLEYWYGNNPHTNTTMNNVNENNYKHTTTIDNTLQTLYYIIKTEDTSNNQNNTASKNINIIDNTPPTITNIQTTPNPQEYQGNVNITCQITDNIQTQTVQIDITGPPGFTHENTTLNQHINQNYFYNNTYNILGNYNYYIYTTDTSNNPACSQIYTFSIQDTTPPVIIDFTPSTATTGDPLKFNAQITDNVQI